MSLTLARADSTSPHADWDPLHLSLLSSPSPCPCLPIPSSSVPWRLGPLPCIFTAVNAGTRTECSLAVSMQELGRCWDSDAWRTSSSPASSEAGRLPRPVREGVRGRRARLWCRNAASAWRSLGAAGGLRRSVGEAAACSRRAARGGVAWPWCSHRRAGSGAAEARREGPPRAAKGRPERSWRGAGVWCGQQVGGRREGAVGCEL
ncbi:hypothetical protein PVAP13_7NG107667 [Panicum virgatum]|uniref:Uncharacterized protein n=1 Tax=Panicum virgatum TaxID=38727 RepID=A0A8T0Q180_PANVG|nr:hypothetical protein PVAP13_7NG107667 [Panicum virgatum]